MRSRPTDNKSTSELARLALGTFLWVTGGCLAYLALGLSLAFARPSDKDLEAPVPCAVIDDLSGELQLLDSTRTRVIDAAKGTGIPCGGWASVEKGWIKLSHRDGYRVHLGTGTFAQFPETNLGGKSPAEPLILLRGQAYVRVLDGSPEFKVLTANARARVVRGGAIVVYLGSEEETQLSSLAGESWLENRFSSTDTIKVRGGESTALNFKLQRTMPTPPRAVAMASLATKLRELRIGGRDEQYALQAAQERGERKFASDLSRAAQSKMPSGGRAPASTPAPALAPVPVVSERELMEGLLMRRLTGGHEASELVRKSGRNPASAAISVDDPDERARLKRQAAEEQERRRLIDELTRIRESD